MTRNATRVAVGLLVGGLWVFAPGTARACEAHAHAAADAKAAAPGEADAKAVAPGKDEAERPLESLDSLIAGKCQCGSKADCTCKKGSCECSKCKPKRQVMDALRGQPAELKLEEARYDASAGIFI
ncbi:metallothionein [Myxococcus sp. K15C18031901]|uniref:metallothionein n=1 Tax=Myxococcus dinghuensis TaxID=2906761 RepID=UPI0020A71A2B|nr:metallothionein [Myxococcus dinghuensis]MCP3103232.1 metallothionein [Myxococcus dinghuensis]